MSLSNRAPPLHHVRLAAARWFWLPLRSEHGVLLIETFVALTILVTLVSATLIGARTAQRVRLMVERQANAETVARNQMEYVFSLPYQNPPRHVCLHHLHA